MVGAVALSVVVAGCGVQIPTDPDGTLDSITGGTLRAGASTDSVLVMMNGGEVSGSEVALIEGFAAEQDAAVQWTRASEETLVTMLEEGEIDVAVGGFTDKTPWAERAGVTRGYDAIDGADGRTLVMLVPLGENRLLSTLERYLDEALEQ